MRVGFFFMLSVLLFSSCHTTKKTVSTVSAKTNEQTAHSFAGSETVGSSLASTLWVELDSFVLVQEVVADADLGDSSRCASASNQPCCTRVVLAGRHARFGAGEQSQTSTAVSVCDTLSQVRHSSQDEHSESAEVSTKVAQPPDMRWISYVACIATLIALAFVGWRLWRKFKN